MADNDKSETESDHPFVRVSAVDPTILSEECYMVRKSEPCTIVIFGASGDLTARKLIPALFNLYKNNGLPDSFSIVGCGRTPLDNQGFRAARKRLYTRRQCRSRKVADLCEIAVLYPDCL